MLIEYDFSIELTEDISLVVVDFDVVPSSGFDFAIDRTAEGRLAATNGVLKAMLRIAPSSKIEPDVVVKVLIADSNEETFIPPILFGLELERIHFGVWAGKHESSPFFTRSLSSCVAGELPGSAERFQLRLWIVKLCSHPVLG